MIQKEHGQINLFCNHRFLFQVLQDEIEIAYENGDRSVFGKVTFGQWETETCSENQCCLFSEKLLPELNVMLRLQVTYTVQDSIVIKKITCCQNHILNLYISLSQRIRHPETEQIWSFGAVKNEAACIYGSRSTQPFPAAGMILKCGDVLGVLMDTGIANEWSGWRSRRTADGNAPAVTAYDTVLMEESVKGKEIRLHAGEYYPTYDIPFEAEGKNGASAWGRKGYGYLLECNVRRVPCRLMASAAGKRVLDRTFETCGRQVIPVLGMAETALIEMYWEEGAIEPLRLYEQKKEARPWHSLRQNEEKSYRYFFFVDNFEVNLRNLRKYAQIHLAEALGFSGTAAEKILYADFRMLNWQAEPGLGVPLCVPSIDYFEMYFRDVFWSVNGVEDKELNETILGMIKNTIDSHSWVDNIITPYFGSREKIDNEINYLFIIWNYLNWKRFGLAPDLERLEGIVRLLLNRYDPQRKGRIKINNPQSLMDVMWQAEPSYFAVSQGYYCLTMKTALALGIGGVDAAYVEDTRREYASYYGEDGEGRKYLRTFPGNRLGEGGGDLDILSCLDLEPEFLSLYLFDESLLGKEIVTDTLDRIPVFEGCMMPIIACADGTFFTKERNPFNGGQFWEAGRYANGGSYLRPQYIALAAGKYHGWKPADELMKKRLKAEFEICQEDPVSMEYLHAFGQPEKCSGHKVFAWNVFVNEINRWIRRTIDPGFLAGEDII